jgi:hypothetical protein
MLPYLRGAFNAGIESELILCTFGQYGRRTPGEDCLDTPDSDQDLLEREALSVFLNEWK